MTAPAKPGRQMTITDLRIHPIKSCRGISVSSSTLTRKGLQYDRTWMFVDAANKFLTIRGMSEMTLITTALNRTTGNLEVTFPSVASASLRRTVVTVPLDPTPAWLEANCTLLDVEIWHNDTDAWAFTDPDVCGPVAQYFEAVNPDISARLVMKGPTRRPTRGNGAEELLGRRESVDFPDVLPVQVASEVSLAELNARLVGKGEQAITIERFRPNVVVGGDELVAWEEDEWKVLRINPPTSLWGSLSTATGVGSASVDVDVACRCARCQVPNVDPVTAVKNPRQPWDLLVSYRRVDQGIKFKPCFGMLCCPRGEGRIEVGMKVEVREVMEAAGGTGAHKYVKGF